MEQRHRHQGGRGEATAEHARHPLGRSQRTERALELQRGQRLANRPMAGQHALGTAGGAGGVKDQRRGFRRQLHGCQRQRFGSQQLLVAQAMRRQLGVGGTPDHDEGAPGCCQVALKQGQARIIADQHTRTAVLHTMQQLIVQAPTVEWHAHRTAALNGGKRHQPGRLVAHGNRYPLARAQAQAACQLASQPVDRVEIVGKAQALLLPDDKFLVAVYPCGVDHLQQVARCMAKIPRATCGWGHHFKWCTGGYQLFPGVPPMVNAHQGSPGAGLTHRPRRGRHNVRNESRDHPGRPGPPAPV